ncbi:Xyloglucan endotransglucosylase/hydrolase protein 20 [Triticum urartu]|uniref:Xyloglucan endotransglucosylase/hydrolase n=1 Tax=Triticum urartu TaxID=4572 RepID=M8AML6_TRIUA|nr:Xyloglucan endotransglucosylase/hydrolase protein 20 [Triticum urartu]
MASPLHCRPKLRLLCVALAFVLAVDVGRADIYKDIQIIWSADHTYYFMDGDSEALALSLDFNRGSAFKSNDMYLFARIDIDIKLVEGNSAGTVCTVYTISEGPWDIHDEIDLEFLGNSTGEPYTLHTNVFAYGVGGREQQFKLWFDPSADYHTYSIVWNPKRITIEVDGVTIRTFDNNEDQGVPFPSWQQQRGDWSLAPFVSYYRNYNITYCRPSPGVSGCGAEPAGSPLFNLSPKARADLQWVRYMGYVLYDYCTDRSNRYTDATRPKECSLPPRP